jgi:hypothetical protein
MKLANLANRPVIVEDNRALDVATASKGRIEPRVSVLSDLTLHDELRNLADSADHADWFEFDRRDLGRVSRPYQGHWCCAELSGARGGVKLAHSRRAVGLREVRLLGHRSL